MPCVFGIFVADENLVGYEIMSQHFGGYPPCQILWYACNVKKPHYRCFHIFQWAATRPPCIFGFFIDWKMSQPFIEKRFFFSQKAPKSKSALLSQKAAAHKNASHPSGCSVCGVMNVSGEESPRCASSAGGCPPCPLFSDFSWQYEFSLLWKSVTGTFDWEKSVAPDFWLKKALFSSQKVRLFLPLRLFQRFSLKNGLLLKKVGKFLF